MYEEIRERAITNLEVRRKKVRSVQIIGVIFGSVVLFLSGITVFMNPWDRPFMLIPIGIILLTFCIIYTAILGLPFVSNDEISEEEIEREMAKIYRKYEPYDELVDMEEDEQFELRQLEKEIKNR